MDRNYGVGNNAYRICMDWAANNEHIFQKVYVNALFANAVGVVSVLPLITPGVLMLQPWYLPSYVTPLAGMIFANSMNSISFAGERLDAVGSSTYIKSSKILYLLLIVIALEPIYYW